MIKRRLAVSICVVFVPLCSCGGDRPVNSVHKHSNGSVPSSSSAKRRYLTHFKGDCKNADRLSQITDERIQRLIGQIGNGDHKAVGQLVAYLNVLAGAFAHSLKAAERLGPPPDPGAEYARRYFSDAANVISALRQLSNAIGQLNASSATTAIGSLSHAADDAQISAKRYGIATCKDKSPKRVPLSGPAL